MGQVSGGPESCGSLSAVLKGWQSTWHGTKRCYNWQPLLTIGHPDAEEVRLVRHSPLGHWRTLGDFKWPSADVVLRSFSMRGAAGLHVYCANVPLAVSAERRG